MRAFFIAILLVAATGLSTFDTEATNLITHLHVQTEDVPRKEW